jgi:hypothetical protein
VRAAALTDIFKKLYENNYPIEKIRLVDEYDADDEKSMRDNNSSCFNGAATGKTAKTISILKFQRRWWIFCIPTTNNKRDDLRRKCEEELGTTIERYYNDEKNRAVLGDLVLGGGYALAGGHCLCGTFGRYIGEGDNPHWYDGRLHPHVVPQSPNGRV